MKSRDFVFETNQQLGSGTNFLRSKLSLATKMQSVEEAPSYCTDEKQIKEEVPPLDVKVQKDSEALLRNARHVEPEGDEIIILTHELATHVHKTRHHSAKRNSIVSLPGDIEGRLRERGSKRSSHKHRSSERCERHAKEIERLKNLVLSQEKRIYELEQLLTKNGIQFDKTEPLPASRPRLLKKKSASTSTLERSPLSRSRDENKEMTPLERPPVTFQFEQNPNEEDSKFVDGKLVIDAATLPQLVNRLASTQTIDGDFIREFILTYKYFTTSQELLDLLIQRYKFDPPDDSEKVVAYYDKWRGPVRLRVINVLKKWIEINFFDFRKDPELLHKFTLFVQNTIGNSENHRWAKTLLTQLEESNAESIIGRLTDSPKPNFPRSLSNLNLSVLDVPSKEHARQLACYEWKMFSRITPAELHSGCWSKENREELAPNVVQMTTWFNKLSYWIASEILKPELKLRTKMLAKWIKIAEECRKLYNFNSLMSILAALGMSCISRLKQTWKELSEKQKETHRKLEELMSSTQNFKRYRQELELHQQDAPVLPYLGIILRDLLFIEEGNADVLPNGMINFQKMRMVAQVITLIQSLQQRAYNFKVVDEIQKLLEQAQQVNVDEEELYQRSTSIERVTIPHSMSARKMIRSFDSTFNRKSPATSKAEYLERRKTVTDLKSLTKAWKREKESSDLRSSIFNRLKSSSNPKISEDYQLSKSENL